MERVICESTAKVPIVKIWDPELCLACDMNVNNTLALENTRMIKTYVQIDPRVRPLAMIIKHWTKRRIVNDAGTCMFVIPRPGYNSNFYSSFWWYSQFVHLDMPDYCLPSKQGPCGTPSFTPKTAHETSPQEWSRKPIRRRS